MKLNHLAAAIVITTALPFHAWSQHDHSKGHKTPTAPKSAKPAPKPAEGASVKIISPTKGQVFRGDQVPIHFKLTKGKQGHHVHAYVDGELMGMFEGEKGILNGIKPGKRTLELRVIMADHETELDATDKVEFVVK